MIPANNFACAEFSCAFLEADTLENCIKRACPFAWQRGRVEDELERTRKDAREAGRIILVDNGGPA